MKLALYNVELVTEFAKDLVWSERYHMLDDQLYILAKQNHRLNRLRGKVDWVITDSPLLISLFHLPPDYPDSFRQFILDLSATYENVFFYMERAKPYVPIGRMETEEESNAIGQDIRVTLEQLGVVFRTVAGTDNAPDNIIDVIRREY